MAPSLLRGHSYTISGNRPTRNPDEPIFLSVARAQNSSIHRLHEAQRSGHIKSFVFPYLGQLDGTLPNPPANLVRREEAHAYPTNFSAMPDEWIERLSLRGEQLTFCLARAYIPHLLDEPSLAPA